MSRTYPPAPRGALRRLGRCTAAGLLISGLATWIITRGHSAALTATAHNHRMSAADVRAIVLFAAGFALTVVLFALTTWFARLKRRAAPASTIPARTRRAGSPW